MTIMYKLKSCHPNSPAPVASARPHSPTGKRLSRSLRGDPSSAVRAQTGREAGGWPNPTAHCAL